MRAVDNEYGHSNKNNTKSKNTQNNVNNVNNLYNDSFKSNESNVYDQYDEYNQYEPYRKRYAAFPWWNKVYLTQVLKFEIHFKNTRYLLNVTRLFQILCIKRDN